MNPFKRIMCPDEIAAILKKLVGTCLTLEYGESGIGVANVSIGSKSYRLTYENCFEKEDGTLHSTLAVIEEILHGPAGFRSELVH